MELPQEVDAILNGSYIVLVCISGYINTGGSLNVTCNGYNQWSQFPNCVPNTGNGSLTTTTTMPPSNGLPCTVNTTTTFNITNGYASSISLSYVSNTTATGKQTQFIVL